MAGTILEDKWANVQLVNFNKDPIFQKALEFLEKENYNEIYFKWDEEIAREHSKVLKGLTEITKKYVKKKKNKLFEYETTSQFYYLHLATNVLVYYLLNKLEIKGELIEFICNVIIEKGFFVTPVKSRGLTHLPIKGLGTYYLALKWFYNEKTKKYYSEELLKEIEEYEDNIQDSMSPGWKERYDFIRQLKY